MQTLHYLLFSAFLLLTVSSFGQTVNDTPIKDLDAEYIQIIGQEKTLGERLNITIDFGSKNAFYNSEMATYRDMDGKVVEFHSMMDALTYLSKAGFEFVDAYGLLVDTKVNKKSTHYIIMRRKI